MQAVPEHPKKDFVFCLSNSVGDAFLFQVRETLLLKTYTEKNKGKRGVEVVYSSIKLLC